MLSVLSKVFGMESATAATSMGHPRQVDLSANRFTFAMPEDFSRDMPAEDLVETLDLEQFATSSDRSAVLLKRWWDIKKPGFFGRNMGTVMMVIAVRKIPQNTSQLVHTNAYDITNRLDFILAIDENLKGSFANTQHKDDFTKAYSLPSVLITIGDRLQSSFRDWTFNGQRWTRYGIAGPASEIINGYTIPLNNAIYIEVLFDYAPDRNASPREFIDVAGKKMAAIRETFVVDYADDNAMRQVVEETWLEMTTDQVMEKNRALLLGNASDDDEPRELDSDTPFRIDR